jgi:hypothetical protein
MVGVGVSVGVLEGVGVLVGVAVGGATYSSAPISGVEGSRGSASKSVVMPAMGVAASEAIEEGELRWRSVVEVKSGSPSRLLRSWPTAVLQAARLGISLPL